VISLRICLPYSQASLSQLKFKGLHILPSASRSPSSGVVADWLNYLEGLHAKAIDLGLDRVIEVLSRLPYTKKVPVITVGGTNGKGSTTAYLEAILHAAGYKTGCYTSPHLLRYNERIRINRKPATDAEIVASFERVEAARQHTSLTYFEFGTIAALHLFAQSELDVLILEVGMGGRLDAVNAVDSDCAIVTSVALDHMEFLGPDRESIALEKAGIYRSDCVAIFGETDVPHSLRHYADSLGAHLWIAGETFQHQSSPSQWNFKGPAGTIFALPYPALRGAYQLDNASCALAALTALQEELPVSMQHIRQGFVSVDLPGRLQVLPGRPTVILDVAHNPHAAAALARSLQGMAGFKTTRIVLGMLRDKDVEGVTQLFSGLVGAWYLCDLPAPRGATAQDLASQMDLDRLSASPSMKMFSTPELALQAALNEADLDDRIVVLGSFLTVASAMQTLGKK
jgi:dihydrofolate synthase / folylpolyglutamate synthase